MYIRPIAIAGHILGSPFKTLQAVFLTSALGHPVFK